MPSPFRSTLIFASRSASLERLIRRARRARPLVDRFVAGETIADAQSVADQMQSRGLQAVYDRLGEAINDERGVQEVVDAYCDDFVAAAPGSQFSLKLSQFGLARDPALAAAALTTLSDRARLRAHRLHIDMEEEATVARTLHVVDSVHRRDGDLGIVVQAMLREAPATLRWAIDREVRVRLVKGAYKESAVTAHQGREEIRRAYLALLGPLLARGRAPALGTHDDALLDAAAAMAGVMGAGYEVQFLYGVREDRAAAIAASGVPVRIYTPYGGAWYPYFMRRMAERPQNLGFFLRQVTDRPAPARVPAAM